MKTIMLIVLIGAFAITSLSQVEGNEEFYSRGNSRNIERTKVITDQPPQAYFESDNSIIIEAKTLYNAQADHFVAVFNLNQIAETASAANEMLESKLKGIKDGLIQLGIKEKDIYVDMLTFVPEYEYDVEKKMFSKTYTEIPKGFRIQKNIHITYKNSKDLDQMVSVCAKNEVYDIVKVQYFSEKSKQYFDSLRTSATKILKDKLKNYKDLGINTENAFTKITENSFVIYPNEQYNSYQAYNSSSIDMVKKKTSVTNLPKTTTSHYCPVLEKGFDLVFNPVITEPVIQYALTLRIKLDLKKPVDENKAEYYMLTPNGTLIPIKK